MVDIHAVGDWTYRQFVGESMRQHGPGTKTNIAVAKTSDRPGKRPTILLPALSYKS